MGTLKSINPANGNVVGEVPVTPVVEIETMVARARAAFASWQALDVAARAERLRPAGAVMLDRAEEIARVMTQEMGKPLRDAKGEVKSCGKTLGDTLDEIVEALAPQEIRDKRTRSMLYRDPFGVCVAISPWNFPFSMPHWMVVPALVAGNTVIMKPSEETPLTGQAFFEILAAHLPDGVLQIAHGADEQGKALVAAADLVAFTGSREAGKHILAAASGKLTRVVLELGGKDPMIVLDDADLEKAARFAVHNSFRNAGQVCVSTERIYVDEKIADAFESEVARLTADLKVGDGTEEGVTVGPMVHARQRDHVLAQIEQAVKAGARVVAGGTGHHDNFVMPTVLTDLTHDMSIMREETFGPVACIVRVQDPTEAVQMANDTRFGLGAVVFGQDETRALDVARQLRAGMIGVNKNCGGADGSPWVGAQESGYGFHSGPEGHRQFTQARLVSIAA